MFRIKSLFFILFWISSFTINSQIPGLTQFTTNNNLPSNTVYDIIQDENGFIYFATDYGISKFDGLTFENFTIQDGLPGNEILFFYKDSQNRIWLSAFNGNVGFLKNGKFYNSKNSPFLKDLKFNRFLWNIYEDTNKNVYFYQDYKNIKKLSPNNLVKELKFNGTGPTKKSSHIAEDKANIIHVVSSRRDEKKSYIITKKLNDSSVDSLWVNYNPKLFLDKSIKNINSNLGLFLSDNNDNNYYQKLSSSLNQFDYLAKIYEVGNSFWVTNLSFGIKILDKGNNYQSARTILKNIKTTTAFIDLENNIWVGSQSNGVFLFPNVNISGFQLENSTRNDLYSINEFNNDLVIGNEFSEIIVLDKKTLEPKFTKIIDNYSKQIRQLKKNNEQLYIVSDFNLHKMDKSFIIKETKDIFSSDFQATDVKNFKQITFKKDTILTANANGISHITIPNNNVKRIWNKRSSSILQVGNDSLWVGTTAGLYLKTNGNFEKFNLNNDFNNSILYDLKNSKHGILIASNSYGLGILNKKGFQEIAVSDGLLSNYIKSIHVDSNNTIWLSSNLGLNKLVLNSSQKIENISSYTTSDGLYSNDVRATYVDNLNQKAYAATANGLNIIDISKNASVANPPKIIITKKLVNNVLLTVNHNSEFKYNSNNFQFNFSGISFKSLGNITFKYRLLGIEKEWIQTNNNIIRYSALNPGTYTFEVKAIAKNKLESINPETYSFIIKPPLYKTWWFRTLIFLLTLSLIYFMNEIKKKKIKEKRILTEKISSLKFQALNAQMNPHFINNLLGNINAQVDKGQFKTVKSSLQNFAHFVNLVLQSTKSNLIPLEQEIAMTKHYLELQKVRFNSHLNYQIDTSTISNDDLEYILVPPMIIQPIVENSLKHGFNKTDITENKISIKFYTQNDDFLICEIMDNGNGIVEDNKTMGSGISIKNIQTRLALMAENDLKENLVSITNITNEFNNLAGVKIILKIPLIII